VVSTSGVVLRARRARREDTVIWLVAIVCGLVAAVAGWFATGALAVWITGLYGMSDFEGQRGMFAFLAVGPIGGLLAMVATVWLVLRIGKGRAPLGRSLARVGGVLAGIAAVVAAAIGVRLLSIDTYTNELPPNLEFEIRIPDAIAIADRDAVRIELHTDENVGEATLFAPWPRSDGDHRVIVGSVPLARKTSGRLLVVTLPGEPVRLFRLSLARDPASTPTLGEWQHATFVDTKDAAQPVAAPKDDPVELRYRVVRAGDE
jgi:hypothetical protein